MKINKRKLAVIALGLSNSGKSNTWYQIFGRTIRTGMKRLIINKNELTVFVRNASFEEAGDEINNFFDEKNMPKIIFCAVQYTEKGIRTIKWFKDHGYYLYIQWINPGYYGAEYEDNLEFEKQFGNEDTFIKRSGKEKLSRTQEIVQFLYEWIILDKNEKQ